MAAVIMAAQFMEGCASPLYWGLPDLGRSDLKHHAYQNIIINFTDLAQNAFSLFFSANLEYES